MVRLYFPVMFKKVMKIKNYPKKVGLGEYDGDHGVNGELFGCRFHGILFSYRTSNSLYFDGISFFIECEDISTVIETAKAIEKALADKGLKFSISHYELTLDIPVDLPFYVTIRNGSCKYEIMHLGISVECEKLEDIIVIKK
jgi:hypothetical protein